MPFDDRLEQRTLMAKTSHKSLLLLNNALKATPEGLFIDFRTILVLHKLQQYEHCLRKEENSSSTQTETNSEKKTASNA